MFYALCKMPGITLGALVNPEIPGMSLTDGFVSLRLRALLVKTDLPAAA
jgi:hypothetical protein